MSGWRRERVAHEAVQVVVVAVGVDEVDLATAGRRARCVARKPISRSSSPRNDPSPRVTSTLPGASPSHWSIRYAAVAPAARLSMPT